MAAKFLDECRTDGNLSFKFSMSTAAVTEGVGSQGHTSVKVTFSNPTVAVPAAEAVVHVRFLLDESMDRVEGFQVEEDPHVWATRDVQFGDHTLTRALDRKLRVRAIGLVNLYDDFSSTRIPAAIRAAEDCERARTREATEENILDAFQRRDRYNDGRFSLADLRTAVFSLDLPTPSRGPELPRELLLALVPPDRDDLVDYGALAPLAADVLDSWNGWAYYGEPDATADENVVSVTADQEAEERAIDAFEALTFQQTQYAANRLLDLLKASVAAIEPSQVGEVKTSDETELPADQEQLIDGEASQETEEPIQTPEEPEVSRRQLRACLESPKLLLSPTEVNLALVLAGDDGLFPIGILPPIIGRARRLVFRYQRRCFANVKELQQYLMRQFEAIERDKLVGSARHLKYVVPLKTAKLMIREELPRLLLSPFQTMRCVAQCDQNSDLVRYTEFVSSLAKLLADDVSDESLAERSAGCDVDNATDQPIPGEDEVRHTYLQVFTARDSKQVGVVSLASFEEATKELFNKLELPNVDAHESKLLLAVADPTESGRVNYSTFQHCIYALLLFLTQRRTQKTLPGEEKNPDRRDAGSASSVEEKG